MAAAAGGAAPGSGQQGGGQERDEEVPTLCLLGATGVGKGSTLNSCFRSQAYSVGHAFSSDTVRPASATLPWRGDGPRVRGVDLCGFSDSEGRDTGFIESMVNYLRTDVGHVNCFLLLFNAQETRIGVHLKDMLQSLKSVFGVALMRNTLIGFTRWDYTKRASKVQKRRGVTKESLAANMNEALRTIVGHDHDCPCVFLDNTLSMCTGEEEMEDLFGDEHSAVTAEFERELEAIRLFATTRGAFRCGSIEGALAERDVGRDRMERERAARAEGEAAIERLRGRWHGLGAEGPEELDARLRAEVEEEHGALARFLASRTSTDLEHVRADVLARFSGRPRRRGARRGGTGRWRASTTAGCGWSSSRASRRMRPRGRATQAAAGRSASATSAGRTAIVCFVTSRSAKGARWPGSRLPSCRTTCAGRAWLLGGIFSPRSRTGRRSPKCASIWAARAR
ncbi:unnamed protein product [Prorocentrum cordatum]|nr:unnamed protein product [Polarella glacialis]